MYGLILSLLACALLLVLAAMRLPATSNRYAEEYPEFSSLRVPWLILSLLSVVGILVFLGAIAIISSIAYGSFSGPAQLKFGRFMSRSGPTLTAISLMLMAFADIHVEAGPISIPVILFFFAFLCIFVALFSKNLFLLIDRSFAMKAEMDQVI